MNKSLATFMSIAITVIMLSTLMLGVVYMSLHDKNDDQQDVLKDEYQLKLKN